MNEENEDEDYDPNKPDNLKAGDKFINMEASEGEDGFDYELSGSEDDEEVQVEK